MSRGKMIPAVILNPDTSVALDAYPAKGLAACPDHLRYDTPYADLTAVSVASASHLYNRLAAATIPCPPSPSHYRVILSDGRTKMFVGHYAIVHLPAVFGADARESQLRATAESMNGYARMLRAADDSVSAYLERISVSDTPVGDYKWDTLADVAVRAAVRANIDPDTFCEDTMSSVEDNLDIMRQFADDDTGELYAEILEELFPESTVAGVLVRHGSSRLLV